MDHILSVVLLTPIAGLLVLLCIPSSQPVWIKRWANIASFLGFLACLPLIYYFDSHQDFQFTEQAPWIPSLGASYYLSIDGYSLALVVLTGLLGFIAVLSSWNAIQHRLKEYYANFLILQASMLGVFMARDFLLFFVFWELGLVPMYFIIAVWGGQRRVYSAFKFIVYTFIGSVVMFLGILALYSAHYNQAHSLSFAIPDLLNTSLPLSTQWWIFWAFFAGFAVKVPMWPLHTWLPDAHTEAPTAGSVILASILLKMGTYGFLRFSLPLLPDASKDSRIVNAMAILSLIAIVYGALVCLMQKDWKKLIAYSSVSHLGFCTLGIFALNSAGIAGSMIQQINHGISTGMLFLIVGIVYERRHTREIAEYGGLLKVMPLFAIVFFVTALSSMGMPVLNGFIGEISILQGAYQMSFNWAFWCAVGIALGAAYLIWLFQRTMLGDLGDKNAKLHDLSVREVLVFAPLLALAFWIGIYPKPLFNVLIRPSAQIVERLHTGSPGQAAQDARRMPVGNGGR
ncbi:MAG TPA: NADH-quinone oxidoreductase subunit M [Aggregatilineales bacterium]|nr:NADH-quinone oxidoreductase subunit M [Aggregatilineales bacterium]